MERTFSLSSVDCQADEMAQKVDCLQSTLSSLNDRVGAMEGHMANLVTIVRKLYEASGKSPQLKFPLQTLSAVEDVDRKIEDNKSKYVSHYTHLSNYTYFLCFYS